MKLDCWSNPKAARSAYTEIMDVVFAYTWDTTPVISALPDGNVVQAGQPLAMDGELLASVTDVELWQGSAKRASCAPSTSNGTSLACDMPADLPAGSYRLVLRKESGEAGVVDPDVDPTSLMVAAVPFLTDITAGGAGSLAGGVALTLAANSTGFNDTVLTANEVRGLRPMCNGAPMPSCLSLVLQQLLPRQRAHLSQRAVTCCLALLPCLRGSTINSCSASPTASRHTVYTQVTVGAAPCRVTAATRTSLTCTTGLIQGLIRAEYWRIPVSSYAMFPDVMSFTNPGAQLPPTVLVAPAPAGGRQGSFRPGLCLALVVACASVRVSPRMLVTPLSPILSSPGSLYASP